MRFRFNRIFEQADKQQKFMLQVLDTIATFTLWRIRLFLQTGAGRENKKPQTFFVPETPAHLKSYMDHSPSWNLLPKPKVSHCTAVSHWIEIWRGGEKERMIQRIDRGGTLIQKREVCVSFKVCSRQPRMQPWQTIVMLIAGFDYVHFKRKKTGEI